MKLLKTVVENLIKNSISHQFYPSCKD